MNMLGAKLVFICLLYSVSIFCVDFDQKDLVIVIPSYNNSKWYKKNLDSVFDQKYVRYRIIYIDDFSQDNTGNLVQEYIDSHPLGSKVTLIKNKKRLGGLANTYYASHSCQDHEVILTLDGDDWLIGDDVLLTINQAYQDDHVWLTYGNYEYFPPWNKPGVCKPIPKKIIDSNEFRKFDWVTSQLRTFYAWLFKRIKKEDLQYNGSFFPMAWDLAMMFPMLEMCGDRFLFINKTLYIYNVTNPINDFKKNIKLQQNLEKIIRKRSKYIPI